MKVNANLEKYVQSKFNNGNCLFGIFSMSSIKSKATHSNDFKFMSIKNQKYLFY